MAMRKDPARRYVYRAIFRGHPPPSGGLPVVARKDTVSYRTGKFIKRNKIGIAASAVVRWL
jgi:hypothetical protein